jgi:hypothetical protein
MLPLKDIVLVFVLFSIALVPVSSQFAGSTAYVSQNGPVRLREALQNNTVTTIVLTNDYGMGNELGDTQPIPITRSGASLLLRGVTSHSTFVCSIDLDSCVSRNIRSHVYSSYTPALASRAGVYCSRSTEVAVACRSTPASSTNGTASLQHVQHTY